MSNMSMDPRQTARPSSIPVGLNVQLFRAKVINGQSSTVDEWMSMLNDRLDEGEATLERERMGVEIVFRQRDGDTEYLYWIVICGEGESVESSHHQLDIDHVAYDERCRERGWETAQPELLLLQAPVRRAVLDACQLT
jgi:hypothetical protein